MSSEFRMLKSLEWCTELPVSDCPRNSPVFLLKGNSCFLRLSLEKEHHLYASSVNVSYQIYYYSMYLEFKEQPFRQPCEVQLEVGFKNEQILSLGTKTSMVVGNCIRQKIWSINQYGLKSKLPSGNRMKFLFSIKNGSECHLNIRKETDDKCLQTASYLNTDVSVESSCEDYSKLLDAGENHDVEIKCGEHTIKAHKIMLCARSEVFKKMLGSDMREGRTGVVEMQDVDVTYVRDFIRYLYTARMPELTYDKAKTLYEMGDKYDVKSLMLRCSEYLQDTLSQENAFECFALADAHSDGKLKNRFISYILKEKTYLQEDVWLPFCESYPIAANEIYKLSYRNVSDSKKVKIFHC